MCCNFVLCHVRMNACCLCFIQTCVCVYVFYMFGLCSVCLVLSGKISRPHVVSDGNSTLVLANRLITTFIPKSHMHLTRIYTNRCTEVGIQKPNSSNVTLVFNQESAQLLPGVC